MAFKYLRPEDVRRLDSYEFAARLLAEGWLAGRHRSRLRGSSIEFHEYRAYSAGDDPALIDWRVLAKTDKPFVKTFEQETNLECHLLVDSSASMGFVGDGPVSKLDFACYFAAALSWLVVTGSDQVSLHLFDDEVKQFLPPGSTRKHLHQLLSLLETNTPGGPTSLPIAIQRAAIQLRRRGTLIVLGDYYDEPARIFEALNPFIHRGFRIHLFHILSPSELEIDGLALARFEDVETRRRITVHPKTVQETYRSVLQEHIARMRMLAAQRQVDYAVARTDGTFWDLLDRICAN